jgi:hypothetical protein
MIRTKILSLLLVVVTTIISACGAAPEPTVSAVDVQNTAQAAAFTMVAETLAAIPTNTALPPTETPSPTPSPTETPVESPTPEVTATLAPQSNTGGTDPCNKPLGANVAGHPAEIRLRNSTNGPLVVSLYLNLTEFGECGYWGTNLEVGGVLTINHLPQGCYNVGVFVNDPDKPTKAFGYGCITNSDTHTFDIFPEVVKFT